MVLFIEEIWPSKVYYMYRIHVNEREKMKFRYLLSEFVVNVDDSERHETDAGPIYRFE
jgi:hypothetical protein